jgi:hypothetical protein
MYSKIGGPAIFPMSSIMSEKPMARRVLFTRRLRNEYQVHPTPAYGAETEDAEDAR